MPMYELEIILKYQDHTQTHTKRPGVRTYP